MPNPGIEVELFPARVEWDGDQAISPDFADIYHSKDGPGEVQRIFVEPCNISQRISKLKGSKFVVAELGFGTGLNCAVFCDLFLRFSKPRDRLHFISFEKHPLGHTDFQSLARRRASALPIYTAIAKHYPPLLGGWHQRLLLDGKITLSYFFGAADTGLSELLEHGTSHYVDHWLLDGFAPAKNPQMWESDLLLNLGKLTAGQGTVATFTAVGQVRRNLVSAGFDMRKVTQHPFKRHSLAGKNTRPRRTEPHKSEAIVVGGGIAGACMAASLAEQGIQVRLLEPHIDTERAGDISPAILHARLLADDSLTALVKSRSYLHSAAWLSSNPKFRASGVLQTLGPNTNLVKLQKLSARYQPSGNWMQLLNAANASKLAGSLFKNPALYFPDSGITDLGSLRHSLYRHENIKPVKETVKEIFQTNGGWRVQGASAIYETQDLILCPGANVTNFGLLRYLELANNYGQLNSFCQALELKLPVIGEGFVCPGAVGLNTTIGATYEQHAWSQARATAYNLDRFNMWWPQISEQALEIKVSDLKKVTRSERSTGIDRLPVIGAVYDADLELVPHLWLSCGHGSSGLSSAPLGAEIISSHILKTPPPTDPRVAEHCSSLRFRVRQKKRS